MTARPQAFRIAVSDADIDDLLYRLDHARYPQQIPGSGWSYGTDRQYLSALMHYWRHEFDWRKQEARLNSFAQFTVDIDGLAMHFIHQRSHHDNATPLMITHGWPGSVVEFSGVIDRLTTPEKYGGSAEDAFHVVCPSLCGYAWSAAAEAPGMNTREIAKRQIKLMALLGYDQYLAQGGDWGAMVTRHIAELDTRHCVGFHLNMILCSPPAVENPDALITPAEQQALQQSKTFNKDGMAYYRIQASRPLTLAYGLQDSPVGLAAWITEKFYAWSDCHGLIDNAISKDDLLTNIALYWFSQSIASSVRLYCEETRHRVNPAPSPLPMGAAVYPKEMMQPVRKWVEAELNVVHWFQAEAGGHFAALEQPDIFSRDLRQFKHSLREQGYL